MPEDGLKKPFQGKGYIKEKGGLVLAASKVSPASHFIRTGKVSPGLDPRKAKRLGARFLSSVWHKTAKSKKGGKRLPLPTFKQRIYGGKLPKADLARIDGQIDFALNAFNGHLSPAKRSAVKRKVKKHITGRMVSINLALREQTTGKDLKTMRRQGSELFTHLKKHGEIYPALMPDTTGKVYFAKGFSSDNGAATGPMHETIHLLQRVGAIKFDVPFAQAADRLYALEKGLRKPNPNIKQPSREEFDRKPGIIKLKEEVKEKGVPEMFAEPEWSYATGTRLGQWLFLNLPKGQRWRYLKTRCNGKSHLEALNSVKKAAIA